MPSGASYIFLSPADICFNSSIIAIHGSGSFSTVPFEYRKYSCTLLAVCSALLKDSSLGIFGCADIFYKISLLIQLFQKKNEFANSHIYIPDLRNYAN